ncbi:MAG: DegT/DnrJ/EryC1/StrS aminotransferase family protein [Cyclobacteriaceae bacterium]
MKYPVYQPKIGELEKAYVNECLDSTWISSKGKFIDLFESAFAEKFGVKHAIAVSNGTVALHAAFVAAGIGPGDEVIVPTFTYIASVNAITYTGAKPIFVDSEEASLLLDPAKLETAITNKTKAILAVHLYGDICDMGEILRIAHKHSILVIEDCAESLGSKLKGRHSGTFGKMATFSFFGNKTLTTGEGGMITTNDDELASVCRRVKGQGLATGREYWHDIIGYNYRMTNICAAIGYAQLQSFDQVVSRKQEIAARYFKQLQGTDIILPRATKDVTNSYWMVNVMLQKAEEREPLRTYLRELGIETRPSFYPVHQMPMYDQGLTFVCAEDISGRGINLPSYPELSDSDIDFICDSIKSYFNH